MDSSRTLADAASSGSRSRSIIRDGDAFFRWCESRLKSRAAWVSAVALVLLLQTVLILAHQPWLDEYQALLIATEPHRVREVLQQLHYEGHPPLWYLFLRTLDLVLPTVWVLPAASLVCAGAIQISLLGFAPFSRLERLMLASGEIFLVEYGTISRGLALGVALTMLCMVLWNTRAVWLSIALLPLCEFVFGLLSIGLIVLRWRERRLSPGGLLLWAVSSAAAALSVVPAIDARHALPHYSISTEIGDFVERVGTIALPIQTFDGHFAWDGAAPWFTGYLLAPLLLQFAFRRTRHSSVQRIIFVSFLGVIWSVSVFVYALHFRYVSLLALLLVVFAWIDGSRGRDILWRSWLLVGAVCGLQTSAIALTDRFDAAPDVATAIRQLDDGRRPWLAYPASRIAPLYALTRKRFIQPEQGCSHGYVLWNHESPVKTWTDYNAALAKWGAVYGQSFIVVETMPKNAPPTVFRALRGPFRGYDGQTYIIGVLAPKAAIKRQSFSPCAPGTPEAPPRQ